MTWQGAAGFVVVLLCVAFVFALSAGALVHALKSGSPVGGSLVSICLTGLLGVVLLRMGIVGLDCDADAGRIRPAIGTGVIHVVRMHWALRFRMLIVDAFLFSVVPERKRRRFLVGFGLPLSRSGRRSGSMLMDELTCVCPVGNVGPVWLIFIALDAAVLLAIIPGCIGH
ncbi:MAG: hypothetical protein JXR94_02620 [Candidatus Hydrogenedentes bacterium]|nr:hypothetical protein [Candidatus Hydrogenedentota bacterium]